MKGLRKYLNFDTDKFLEGKELIVASAKSVRNDSFEGISLEALIVQDDSDNNLNLYQKFYVKIPNGENLLPYLHLGQRFKIGKCEKASVFGDYSDKLSLTCSSIQIIDDDE